MKKSRRGSTKSMTKTTNFFFSCVESRVQDQGSLYARFHIGTFFRGQAITFANTVRRSLLSEIPGVSIRNVVIEGADHEFATLPGVKEPVLNILLNLQKVVFAPCLSPNASLKSFQATGLLKGRGPGQVTAAHIKLSRNVRCITPKTHIATLTSGEEFSLQFTLAIQNQTESKTQTFSFRQHSKSQTLSLQSTPLPVQKVNYVIKQLNSTQPSEYVVLEIWTDGSVVPQEALQFALKNVTNFFYQFAALSSSKT